jgi:hypothetical protein
MERRRKMTRKTKIIIAICGGAAVGALGTCAVIFTAYAVLFTSLASAVALGVGLVTGISITKES